MGFHTWVSSLRRYKYIERLLDDIAFYKRGEIYYRLCRKLQGANIPESQFWNDGKKYFANPEIVDIVNSNIAFLEDTQSVVQYKGVIKARQTLRYADLPNAKKKKLPTQYFDKDIIPIDDTHVFIDGGAWVGDSIYWLNKRMGGFRKIVAFEPGDRQYGRLKERYGKDKRVSLIHAGLWSADGELMFRNSAAGGDAKIVTDDISENCIRIPVKSIDQSKECRQVTFIKMDIEGSEQAALKGAEQTIRRNHPILAICLYHSNEDMVKIPKWLHDNFPEYKFYFRHYSYGLTESVLYAIPRVKNGTLSQNQI